MPFGPKRLKKLSVSINGYTPIPGFDGYYINRCGQILCVRELSTYQDKDGYSRLMLQKGSQRVRRAVHRLLAMTFLPAPANEQNEVRHLDGNPRNNSIDNLAWGTRKENAEDMADHGSVKGERNSRALLTEDQVRDIRKRRTKRGTPIPELAERFGVSESTIKAVVSRRLWPHVE